MKRGNLNNIVYCTVLMMIILSFGLGVNVAAENEFVIDEFLPYSVGDYFDYEMNINDMLTKMVEDDDSYTSYKDVETKTKVSITGSEMIDVDGDSRPCWLVQYDIQMKYTIVGDGEDLDELKHETTGVIKEHHCKANFAAVKSMMTLNMREEEYYPEDYWYESIIYEAQITEEDVYSDIEEKPPLPLKKGKTWTATSSYKSTTESKYRLKLDDDPWTDWETEDDVEDVSETLNYEVLSENEIVVPAGTFDTLKIKKQVKGETDYSIFYNDRFGMSIEEQSYDEDGALSEVMSLKDFQYEQAKDSDGDEVIDQYDAFPNDPEEYVDADKDGVGDNGDVFPNDANETLDTDNDTVGDNADAFPADPAASLDTDSDGYPDSWNTGKTKKESTTGLKLDEYPTDANKWKKEDEGISNMLLIAIVIVVVVVILVVIMMMMKKKKPSSVPPPPQDQYNVQQAQYQNRPPRPQYPSQPPQYPSQTPPPPPNQEYPPKDNVDWY